MATTDECSSDTDATPMTDYQGSTTLTGIAPTDCSAILGDDLMDSSTFPVEFKLVVDQVLADVDVHGEVATALGEGVLIVVESGRIVWSNDAACRLLHLTRDQMAGREELGPHWKAVRLDGSEVPREEQPGMRALATGVPVKNSVMGVRAGDDHDVWLLIDSTPTMLNGRPAAVTVFTDITDQITRRRQFADTMSEIRRTLVQPDMPSGRGVYFTARHRSVGPSQEIGGDFFGAHQLDATRFGFYIGDACGHGVRAAGLSALARHTLRSAGSLLDDPSEVLRHLHDVVATERPDTYLTAIYGYIDIQEHTTVRFACGGHPLPLLIGNGAPHTFGEAGPIIGMVRNQDRPVTVHQVGTGEQMVLHTDGLSSTRERDVDPADLLASLPSRLITDVLADLVLSLAEPSAHVDSDDDTSVLAIGFH